MEIVVEIIDPTLRSARIEKLDATELHVGRAWKSDILVTDPDVDAEHLLVELTDDADRFTVTDLQSTNGSRHNRKKFEGRIQVGFGDMIQLGRTRLRIHRLHDPVPVTKQRSFLDNQLAQLHRPLVALILATSAILLQLLDMYLSSSRDLEWHSVLTSLIGMTSGLAVFALILSGLGKLFRNEFVYWPNLGLAASAIILQKLFGVMTAW
ncbi:MAG: FHA domain-containing protein, partial [Gammaproteobacteria bacterium]